MASSVSVIDEKDSSKMEICGKGGRDVSATGAEPSGTSEMLTVNDTGNCCARDRHKGETDGLARSVSSKVSSVCIDRTSFTVCV